MRLSDPRRRSLTANTGQASVSQPESARYRRPITRPRSLNHPLVTARVRRHGIATPIGPLVQSGQRSHHAHGARDNLLMTNQGLVVADSDGVIQLWNDVATPQLSAPTSARDEPIDELADGMLEFDGGRGCSMCTSSIRQSTSSESTHSKQNVRRVHEQIPGAIYSRTSDVAEHHGHHRYHWAISPRR